MNFTLLDRSNYFRGLLLLAAKDKKLSDSEISIMQIVGSSLGFEKSFYEESIKNLLENEYISNDPPKFSNRIISERFIMDGFKLALSDTNLDPDEIKWLKKVAQTNSLGQDWFSDNLKSIIQLNKYSEPLEIMNPN